MKQFIFYFFALLLTGMDWSENYADDLISKGRSDSNIKFLTPPMSLTVIHNRPKEESILFFIDDEKQLNDSHILGTLNSFMGDPKTIKHTLLKTDPARLIPAKKGIDLYGPVTRLVLRNLAKDRPTDLILIFRWKIFAHGGQIKLSSKRELSQPIRLTAQGLVYISKQGKVLSLPDNTQTGTDLSNLTHVGLKTLAEEARKTILAQKKIISKSY